MKIERMRAGACSQPFPVYERLVESLLASHRPGSGEPDATVAHVLGTCAGYSYGDIETMSEIVGRLGLESSACVGIAQILGAMFVYSTAYLIQSRCGRVVILCYRGTETTNLGNWLGDADVGSESIVLNGDVAGVHAGFYRNVQATRHAVLQELGLALEGGSLANPGAKMDQPMESLYVAGHSLGGAMAVLFTLGLVGSNEYRPIAERLRAVYTFGQPLTVGEPLPRIAQEVGRKLYRYVMPRDIVPALPPVAWGRMAHFGNEYRCENGQWEKSAVPIKQLSSAREIPNAFLTFLAPLKRRTSARYSTSDHGPHVYIAALRPKGRVTEYGDQE
jgi:hypothetical protein